MLTKYFSVLLIKETCQLLNSSPEQGSIRTLKFITKYLFFILVYVCNCQSESRNVTIANNKAENVVTTNHKQKVISAGNLTIVSQNTENVI